MKNFIVGIFLCFTAIVIFWAVFIGGAYVWTHMSDDGKAIVALIMLPLGISTFFAYYVGEAFLNWKNRR